ncbi:RsiV family protein [Flavobacterium sp. CBA20B-1]|uniref:RsiV family protein n=1 Tax=unclassified Flavobacterium TaxID=196869 RepID=UPI00222515A4|nr:MULTISPECIES: RsiV family protein [unclassified Flavobacterium]WCM41355.1 RsiV family protein [Flavobacterium sp. CBA20B-1]
MKKIILFICLSIAFVACKKANSLKVTQKTYSLQSALNCVPNNCTYAHIEVPFFWGNNVVAKPINDSIFKFVQEEIRFQDDKTTASYDTLVLNFINHYNEIFRTYPENALAWEASFKASHQAVSHKLYQVVYDYYMFKGGAHGLQQTKVFVFDTNTGKIVPQKELFVNLAGFKKFAETEFKKQMNITGNLNDAGFTFENNQFHLPNNFYQTQKEWILHYNPYEIAPYVQGATVIKLPKEKVKRFLNPIYFKN